MHELSLKVPNNLNFRILGNTEIWAHSLKCLQVNASAQLLTQSEIVTVELKNCKKSNLRHFSEKSIFINFKNLFAIFSLRLLNAKKYVTAVTIQGPRFT